MHGAWYALLAAALFGLSNVLGRIGIARSSVYTSVIWNVLASSAVFVVALAVWFLARGAAAFQSLNFAAVPYFIGAGLVNDFLARLSLYASAARLGASRSTAFRVVSPIVTVAAGLIFLGERLSTEAAGGILMTVAGIFVVSRDSLATSSRRARTSDAADAKEAERELEAGGESLGDSDTKYEEARAVHGKTSERGLAAGRGLVLGGLAALCFGAGDIFRKQGIGMEPFALLGATVSSWTGIALFAALGAARGVLRDALRPGGVLPLIAFSGAITGIAVLCFLTSMQTLPVSIATTINGTQALFAIFFGWLLDRKAERVTWLLGAGVLLTVFGLRLVFSG